MRIGLAVLLVACAREGAMPNGSDGGAPDGGTVMPFQPALGAHWAPDGSEVVFRVASTRATRIELELFDQPSGSAPVRSVVLEAGTDHVFTAHVAAAALPATIYYGYRAWGPNWPYDAAWTPGSGAGWLADVDTDGDRMNPNKLVFDPYALELSHDPQTPTQGDGTAYAVGSHRDLDSAPVAPRGIVLREDPVDFGAQPARPLRDDVIYEVHVRGFTNAAGGDCAGTYAAAGERADYLHDLGITAIELMPLAETQNDRNDVDPASDSGDNYWGYSTLAYFAPDRRYACDRTPGGPTRELRAMVKAFHDRGIKVFVDVVYNHTAEGGGSSLLSLRGLDNAGYYQLDAAGTGFTNSNGVGADVAAQKPLSRRLVLDSLHYWHESLGVDGFRFDLAPVLGNTSGPGGFHFDPSALPQTIASELPGAALIAEPWAVVAGSYQVGHFPAGWSEWNDKFRDTIREDQNEAGVTAVTPGALAARIAGSKDAYASRSPEAGITYLVSHDGFTLHDLYACDGSSNAQAWPYGPSNGGSTSNHSWAHNGDAAAQRQAIRTGLALELVSAGVPMLEGGDEVAHGLRCNNNPYNLDSPATWIDFAPATDPLWTFTQRLLAFRAAHAALRPSGWTAPIWYDDAGHVASGAYLSDATRAILGWSAGRDLYLAYNRGPNQVTVTLPPAPAGLAWYRAANTAAFLEAQANFVLPGDEAAVQPTYDLDGRALAIFVAR